jgi:hypothetical protein
MKKYSFIIALLLVNPLSALASSPTISCTPPTGVPGVGDTVLVPVLISVPDPTGINSLQARIEVSGSAHLVDVSTGGSVFTLWPEQMRTGNSVSLVGGIPGGSVYGSPLRVITLALSLIEVGTVRIRVSGVTAYVGDGKGTPLPMKDTSISFTVGPKNTKVRDELATLRAKDITSPESFSIIPGQDPSLYNGAYFISFETHDSGSGVARYEVQENGGEWVPSSGTYVLTDQSGKGTIVVRAIDASGNVRTENINFTSEENRNSLWVGIAVLLVTVIGFFVWKRRHR